MCKKLNIIKWNHPNWQNMDCYSSKRIAGEVGDIIENKWIVVGGGKCAVKLANLTLIDIMESNFPIEHSYFKFDCMKDNLMHRYYINHGKIKKREKREVGKYKTELDNQHNHRHTEDELEDFIRLLNFQIQYLGLEKEEVIEIINRLYK